MEGFIQILDNFIKTIKKMEPKSMIKNGLKNWVFPAVISNPNKLLLTLVSAKTVNDVPACSNNAQKTMFKIHRMINKIILSSKTFPPFTPSEIK